MKLYQIIQTVGGKETVKMVDSLPVCNGIHPPRAK